MSTPSSLSRSQPGLFRYLGMISTGIEADLAICCLGQLGDVSSCDQGVVGVKYQFDVQALCVLRRDGCA